MTDSYEIIDELNYRTQQNIHSYYFSFNLW